MSRRVSLFVCLLFASTTLSCGTSTPSDFTLWPTNLSNYDLESLAQLFTASFARGDAVYISRDNGEIVRLSDADPTLPSTLMGKPDNGGAQLLFVTGTGTILSSAFHLPMYRSGDNGLTWQRVLETPCWRMDEDDVGHLYAGNYSTRAGAIATLFKSTDDGRTWAETYRPPYNRHIHSVRWDPKTKRVYITFGDSPMRGQAFSDDHGATFQMMSQGTDQGFTDLAMLDDCLLWGSDDGTGRVYREDRQSGLKKTVTSGSGFIWFTVGQGQQAFVGSVASRRDGGDRGALLATDDDGETWTKILETRLSNEPYGAVIYADSRSLSAGGWLYFTADLDDGSRSFRVRQRPN